MNFPPIYYLRPKENLSRYTTRTTEAETLTPISSLMRPMASFTATTFATPKPASVNSFALSMRSISLPQPRMLRAQFGANFAPRDFYVYHQIFVESIFVFCSPPRPHITVISIQPQQGPPDNLVLTELFTLIYWGMHFARRVREHGSLPVSDVLMSR